MRNPSPCKKDCPDRKPGCNCKAYQDWRAERNEENKKIRAERNRDARLTHFAVDMARKRKKKRGF